MVRIGNTESLSVTQEKQSVKSQIEEPKQNSVMVDDNPPTSKKSPYQFELNGNVGYHFDTDLTTGTQRNSLLQLNANVSRNNTALSLHGNLAGSYNAIGADIQQNFSLTSNLSAGVKAGLNYNINSQDAHSQQVIYRDVPVRDLYYTENNVTTLYTGAELNYKFNNGVSVGVFGDVYRASNGEETTFDAGFRPAISTSTKTVGGDVETGWRAGAQFSIPTGVIDSKIEGKVAATPKGPQAFIGATIPLVSNRK